VSEWISVADEPKKESKDPKPSDQQPTAASISPAPTEVTDGKPADGSKPPAPDANAKVQAEPLSDGTVPTVLNPGDGHRTVPKSKASITSIYRKADIMTTLLTFAGAIVAGALILGGYYFFTKSKAGTPTPTPKVTTLDKSELDKLDSFFGGNSAGKSAEVLTVSSSSLFKNRVGIASDLKVVGSAEVSGTTSLADLNVEKTSTLGITNVRGQLTVNGPLTVQSATLFNAGATFKGAVSATGNGSFGGSLSAASISVQDLSVNGSLNVNGHINIGGLTPSASADTAAGSGATAAVQGNDAAGTVTVTTGTVPGNSNLGGEFVKVTFRSAYPSTPTIIVSPDSRNSARLQPFVLKNANWFIISTSFDAIPHSSYSFDYWVVR